MRTYRELHRLEGALLFVALATGCGATDGSSDGSAAMGGSGGSDVAGGSGAGGSSGTGGSAGAAGSGIGGAGGAGGSNGGMSGSANGGSSGAGGAAPSGGTAGNTGGVSCDTCSGDQQCIYQMGGPGPARFLCAERDECGMGNYCGCLVDQGVCFLMVSEAGGGGICWCDNGLE